MAAEEFEDIIAGVIDEIEVPPTNHWDYTLMSSPQLMRSLILIRTDLMHRGVMMQPVTEDDMDKQSVYFGLMNEMRRRGIF